MGNQLNQVSVFSNHQYPPNPVWCLFVQLGLGSIVLGFLRKVLRLTRWDLTSFCLQFENRLERQRLEAGRGCLPWYKVFGMGNSIPAQ